MRKSTIFRLYPTLSLYLIGEFLFSFLVCFLFYFLIFFLNQLLLMAQDILAKGIAVSSVLLLLFYAIPSIITLTVPFGVLTAALMAFGRFSSDNEIFAMNSAGFQKFVIFRPILVLGVLIALFSFMINDIIQPAGTTAYQRLWLELSLTNPGLELDNYSARHYQDALLVSGLIDKEGIHPMVIFDRDNSGNRTVLVARLAAPQLRGQRAQLPGFQMFDIFTLSADTQDKEAWSWTTADSMEYRLLRDFNRMIDQQSTAVNMRVRDIAKTIDEKSLNLDGQMQQHTNQLGSTGWAFMLNYAQISGADSAQWAQTNAMLANLQNEIQVLLSQIPKDYSLQRWKLEYYQKYAIPFACIPFVILAFPLGLSARRSGRAVGFFSGLILTTLYWSILIIGRSLGLRADVSPFVVMVLPNILLLIIGVILFVMRKQQ